MNEKPLIETRKLCRNFDQLKAVDRLNLEVYPGEVVGLLGHNGAGKTTTVRLLNGLLKPTSGRVRVLGLDPFSEGSVLRVKTGVLTETPSLDERLTGRENLTIFADLYQVEQEHVTRRVDFLLDQFDLRARGDDPVRDFSKGMKQRLALARTLIHDPQLLFLDEPTAGLDPVSTRDVHDLIRSSTAEGKTVLLCTHNLEEAQKLCHRVAVLREGRVIASGTPRELGQKISGQSRVKVDVARADLSRALDLFRDQEFAAEINQRSEMIELRGIERSDIPALIEHAVSRKLNIYQVVISQPTLEDIYFALHHHQENDNEPKSD